VLEAPPKESEKLSWAYEALGVLMVYCTIPSAVSASIITRMNAWQVLFLFAGGIIALLLSGWRLSRLQKIS